MRTLRISVRRLVEFLLRSGSIDSQNDWRGGIEAMQAGSSIHRMLQASGGGAYQAEVSLAGSVFFPGGAFSPHAARLAIREEAVSDQEGFFLCIEGRADGIVDDGVHPLVVDEIKGVSRDVESIADPLAVHEAQALCYAYLYLRNARGPSALATAFGENVVVRLTYASMTTGEVRKIERTYAVPSIESWFFCLLEKAQPWAAWRVSHDNKRQESLEGLAFPFKPRAGQSELMDAVASAIHEGRRLYVQAPTGSGKTIATLYPALKAMGTGEVDQIAFLTAKTTTRGPILECLDLLRQQRIATNVLVVTAQHKMCPLRIGAQGAAVRVRPLSSLCNPVECPFARGHYDAVNDALWEAITTSDVLDLECIQSIAARHHVCPYELQRDATRWADVIVCDYHYAFSPSASFFGLPDEPNRKGTVFLVDEAHNLAERMRSMYSAGLSVHDLESLARLLKGGPHDQLAQMARTVVQVFPKWDKTLPQSSRASSGVRSAKPIYQLARMDDSFVDSLTALADGIAATLEKLSPSAEAAATEAIETFLALRDADYGIRSFLGALQRSETGYATFLNKDEKGGRRLTIFCVDPSHDLGERLEQAKAAVFFSGTLLPMEYHRKLLAAQDDDKSLFAQSGFDRTRQQVLVASDLSARYSERGPKLYAHVAAYLKALMQARPGNYLAFLPSYAMLEEVAHALEAPQGRATIMRQRPAMHEDERDRFVARFRSPHPANTSLLGLCVLGGVFGESIDLPGESLVGVAVVGTGMPRASAEREVMRDYFDAKEGKGFAYAYTYPGLSKVLQAAGRLIRTEADSGVVLLLDNRFLERKVRTVLPKEWDPVRTCTLKTLPELLARP